MSNLDKIRAAEDNVAKLQEQLDGVQRALQRTEKLVATAEAAKQQARRLMLVAGGVLAVGVLALVVSRRRGRSS